MCVLADKCQCLGKMCCSSFRWRQQSSPKHWCLFTTQHHILVVVVRVCLDSWRSSRGFSRLELLSKSSLPLPSPEFTSHLCVPCSKSFPPPPRAPFSTCTASFKTPKHRPVASLMLSSHRIHGFPCLLYPATCPCIMSRSSDPFALIPWPK